VNPKTMTWEQLEAAGLCECGRKLDGHPPIQPWRKGPPPVSHAHQRGQALTIKAEHQR
jgi:hypothetical protein